jgi:2-polyprenyl-3-methyl-5-hydroxy-6-metoxy-1,4-benzoquinol methylase
VTDPQLETNRELETNRQLETDRQVEANRANWNERVEGHLLAYRAEEFAADPAAISGVVRDDLELMRPILPNGSPDGLRLLHLQCHIGTDTLSWARLGAEVTGVDFSREAVEAARELATKAKLPARFVESTVDDAATAVGERFDIVYTSIGVLLWLPRLDSWARTVFDLLEPGGVFFVRDTHPVLSALDYDRDDGELVLRRPYFGGGEPLRYDEGTSYVELESPLQNRISYEWPHPISEIITCLLDAGLEITSFQEQRTIPWRALRMLEPVPGADGFALPSDSARVPLTFSLSARRPEETGPE